MDELAVDLSLSPPSQLTDGLLELSLGSDDTAEADVLDQSGDISFSTKNILEHVDDPLVHEASANSLIESDEDIYTSLLIEDDLTAGQSVVLSSTIDQSLMPGNISPALLEQSKEDPLLSPVFSFDELLESESAEHALSVDETNDSDSTVLRDVDMQEDLTSEDIVSVALDQGLGVSESDAVDFEQNWSVAKILHDDQALEDSESNEFLNDLVVAEDQGTTEGHISLNTNLFGALDEADRGGDISLSIDHVDDSLAIHGLVDSLSKSDEDIYVSYLNDEEFNPGHPVVLNSTGDHSLMLENMSSALLEKSNDDSLPSPVSSSDELRLSESTGAESSAEQHNDPIITREVEVNLDPTSEEIVSVALDQLGNASGREDISTETNWSIANITHDDKALEESDWNAFSIDSSVPGLQSFTEEKLYLQAKLVGESEDKAIDINVFDNRKTTIALTGISLDLAWNSQHLTVNESQFEPGVVFSQSGAPLFQSVGKMQSLPNDEGGEIQMISGLTAAALPSAGSGKPMGKTAVSGSPQTTIFASIPVHHSASGETNGFSLRINEAVQSDGVALRPDELEIVVDEQEKPVLNIDRSILDHGDYIVDVIDTSSQINRVYVNHSLPREQLSQENESFISSHTQLGETVSDDVVLTRSPAPLLIESADAELVSPGLWKQSVTLKQDQKPWNLSLDGLFSDSDIAHQLDVIQSGQLPSWLDFSAKNSFTAGELTAKPTNSDIGNSSTQLSFIDPDGQMATLLLDFSVENINDAPSLLRSDEPFALTIDSDELNQAHQVSRRLDLSELFEDPDQVYGDHLEFSITGVLDQAGQTMDDTDWVRINYAATELGGVDTNVDLRPQLSLVDDFGQSQSISIEDVADLESGSMVDVDIVLSDKRDVDDPGLIAVDYDIQLSESFTLQKDSITLSSALPIFQNIDFNESSESLDFSTLSIQAGSLPRFGMGECVGEQSHVLSRFTLEVSDPKEIHSIGIAPGEGSSRDGLLDLYGESIESNLISAHSLSSRAASYLEVVSAQSLTDGQYLVSVQATDRSGESASYQLPILVGSAENTDTSIQPMASAMLRQMSSEALYELFEKQSASPENLSFSQSIALGGLSQLSSFESTSMQSAMEDGRFHISPSAESSLPLLALYAEGSSNIQAENLLQSNANELLEDLESSSSSVEAPLGALEFSVIGTDQSEVELVNIALAEGGVELNRLYKSNRVGDLQTFASEVIVPPEDLSVIERDQWLHSLSYSIYDYSLDNYQSVSSFSSTSGLALTQQSLKDDVVLSDLDGSAYLIDFDNDGLTDMISLALLDQGYFDLDSSAGVIKDPVVPIYDVDYGRLQSSTTSSSDSASLDDSLLTSSLISVEVGNSNPTLEVINPPEELIPISNTVDSPVNVFQHFPPQPSPTPTPTPTPTSSWVFDTSIHDIQPSPVSSPTSSEVIDAPDFEVQSVSEDSLDSIEDSVVDTVSDPVSSSVLDDSQSSTGSSTASLSTGPTASKNGLLELEPQHHDEGFDFAHTLDRSNPAPIIGNSISANSILPRQNSQNKSTEYSEPNSIPFISTVSPSSASGLNSSTSTSVDSDSEEADEHLLSNKSSLPVRNSASSFSSTVNRLVSLDSLSQINQSFRGVVDDLSIHLSDLGGSLLATLGLTSVPYLSQLSTPAFHRIRPRQPLTITQRLNQSRLHKNLLIPGTYNILSLSIQSGKLSIASSPSGSSCQDLSIQSSLLSDLYCFSTKPGLFAHECLDALKTLTSDNKEPVDWLAWIRRLSSSTCPDVQTGILNKTLGSSLSELKLVLSSSPSAADLYMATAISGLLLSKGFACSDLPGFSA